MHPIRRVSVGPVLATIALKAVSTLNLAHKTLGHEIARLIAKGRVLPTDNDLVHKTDMGSLSVGRDEAHAQRFPTGLFTDELGTELGAERVRQSEA